MKSRTFCSGLIALVLCGLLAGCGDDGGSARPVTGVDITLDSVTLEVAETQEFSAAVTGGESKAVDWYVNGILGGNSEVGTIVAASPATYTAPGVVPEPATVVVKAVSREDENMADSCLVTVQFTRVYVNASSGDDAAGTGSAAAPLKTITAGLQTAEAEMTVLVASGTYDAANGEVFPLQLPDRVTVVGEDWENTVIRGHSETAAYTSMILIEGEDCSLRKFTLEEGEVIEEGWRLAVYIDHADRAVLDSIRVLERAEEAIVRIWYSSETIIENCYFAVDDGHTWDTGIQFNTNVENTIIRNCTVRGFSLGISLNNFANPVIEGCTIEGNRIGVHLCCVSLVNHNPNPDLGGGARDCAGGNTIRGNTDYGIDNQSTNTIFAKFNTWENDPPVDGVDFRNVDTGTVVWE